MPAAVGQANQRSSMCCSFWDHDAGEVTLSGADIRCFATDEVRARLSVVPQDSHLFRGTIRDNLFVADAGATDERIEHACRVALLDEVIRGLPLGLDTLVGEDGAALSGGERQRVAIARAVLKDAPISILDEPSASLNPALEARLAVSLGAYLRTKATLLITHHPALLALADMVYDCDGGQLTLREGKPGAPVANPPHQPTPP